MATDAERKAIAKYQKQFDDIKVRVPKGKREKFKDKAYSRGMSLNQYIIWLIENDTVNAALPDQNQN